MYLCIQVSTGLNYSGDVSVLFVHQWVRASDGFFEDMIDGFGTRVYTIGVKSCPPASADAVLHPSNILINPSFEESVNVGWPLGYEAYDGGDHGATAFQDGSRSAHGRYSMRLTTPLRDRGLHLLLTPVLLCGDKVRLFRSHTKQLQLHLCCL